jgi:hypothetical protein
MRRPLPPRISHEFERIVGADFLPADIRDARSHRLGHSGLDEISGRVYHLDQRILELSPRAVALDDRYFAEESTRSSV